MICDIAPRPPAGARPYVLLGKRQRIAERQRPDLPSCGLVRGVPMRSSHRAHIMGGERAPMNHGGGRADRGDLRYAWRAMFQCCDS